MSKQSRSYNIPKIGIAFLFITAVLLSLIVVSAATMFALEAGRQEAIPASMLAQSEANYQADNNATPFGQLHPQIIMEATKDSAQLAVTPTAKTMAESLRDLIPESIAQLFPTPLPTKLPVPVIANLDPEILQTAVPINANTQTPTRMQPTASTTPTTAVTVGPTQTPTKLFTATAAATTQPTLPPTVTFTPTFPATATQPPTATQRPPTNPPQPTSTNTAVPPTSTATTTAAVATVTATATIAPTTTATGTATATATTAATPTATATATTIATATATATSTATATATATLVPCTGSGFPNVGAPDGSIAVIACGQSVTLNLGGTPLDLTPPDGAVDLVYYEMQNPAGFISVDWVIIEISKNGTDWVQIFNWGDGNPANNASISGPPEEPDNYIMPLSALYNGSTTGIAIDADALASPGTYPYIRITSPLGGENDGSEVDSIQLLP